MESNCFDFSVTVLSNHGPTYQVSCIRFWMRTGTETIPVLIKRYSLIFCQC